jgi:hypothetical protein
MDVTECIVCSLALEMEEGDGLPGIEPVGGGSLQVSVQLSGSVCGCVAKVLVLRHRVARYRGDDCLGNVIHVCGQGEIVNRVGNGTLRDHACRHGLLNIASTVPFTDRLVVIHQEQGRGERMAH